MALAAMVLAIVAVVALIVMKARGGSSAPTAASVMGEWQQLLVAGELDRATAEVHEAAV